MKTKMPTKSKHTIRFVESGTNRPFMPLVLQTANGLEVGKTSSYNSFTSRDEVQKFIRAQRVLAEHFDKGEAFDKALQGYELERTISYSAKEKI